MNYPAKCEWERSGGKIYVLIENSLIYSLFNVLIIDSDFFCYFKVYQNEFKKRDKVSNLKINFKNAYAENEQKRVSIDLFGFKFVRDG
jgi:hypothetical protein